MMEELFKTLISLSWRGMHGVEREEIDFIHKNSEAFECVSPQESYQKLKRILCGAYVIDVLLEYPDVFSALIPELKPIMGFEQRNKFHIYDVWKHTVMCVGGIRPNPVLRVAMLFHDVGKPAHFTVDEDGHGHFYGHPETSAKIVGEYLQRAECEEKEAELIERLVYYHDARPPVSDKSMRKYFREIGRDVMPLLLEVKMADAVAHKHCAFKRNFEDIARIQLFEEKIRLEEDIIRITDLEIGGYDLQEMGVPKGEKIGEILRLLLKEVDGGKLANDFFALRSRVEEVLKENH